MKRVRRCFAATALTLAFALTALAGHIPCGVTSPPPAPATGQTGTGTPGDMPNGGGSTDPSYATQGEISTGALAPQAAGGDISTPPGRSSTTLWETVMSLMLGLVLQP